MLFLFLTKMDTHIVLVGENLKPFSSHQRPNLLRDCCNFLSIDGMTRTVINS